MVREGLAVADVTVVMTGRSTPQFAAASDGLSATAHGESPPSALCIVTAPTWHEIWSWLPPVRAGHEVGGWMKTILSTSISPAISFQMPR